MTEELDATRARAVHPTCSHVGLKVALSRFQDSTEAQQHLRASSTPFGRSPRGCEFADFRTNPDKDDVLASADKATLESLVEVGQIGKVTPP